VHRHRAFGPVRVAVDDRIEDRAVLDQLGGPDGLVAAGDRVDQFRRG